MIADSQISPIHLQDRSRFLLSCSLIALCSATAFHGWVFRVPAMELGWRGEDDACYYYVIAKNLVAGNGFTFDGLNRTNGFHPLWLGVTAVIFGGASDDSVALRSVYVLQWLLYAVSAVGVAVLARAAMGKAGAVAAMLLFQLLPSISVSMLNGMETVLAVALVVGAFCYLNRIVAKDCAPSRLQIMLMSLLAAGSMLARLECGLIVLVIAFVFRRRWPKIRSSRWMQFVALSTAPLLAWLLFSQVHFGSITPVSGMIKRAGAMAIAARMWGSGDYLGLLNRVFELRVPSDGLAVISLSQFGIEFHAGITRAIGFVCLLAPLAVPGVRRRLGPAISAIMVFSLLIVVAGKVLFFGRPMPMYYLVPLFITFPIAFPLLFAALLPRIGGSAAPESKKSRFLSLRLARPVGVAIMTPFVLGAMARQQLHEQHRILTRQDGYFDSVYAAARWVNENTRPSDTVAAWNAGIIGFYSGRRVVNLDGYVNSVSYARQLTSHSRDLEKLIAGLQVGVLVDRISDGQSPLDRAPELAGHWREVARVEARRPNGLNGGFCAYAPVDSTAGMMRDAIDIPLD